MHFNYKSKMKVLDILENCKYKNQSLCIIHNLGEKLLTYFKEFGPNVCIQY